MTNQFEIIRDAGKNGATVVQIIETGSAAFFCFHYRVIDGGNLFCYSFLVTSREEELKKESLRVMAALCKEYKQDRVLIEIEGDEKTANFLKENGFVIEEEEEGIITASKKI